MPTMTPQYQDSYYLGNLEAVSRVIDVFNAASNGTLLIGSDSYMGDYEQYADYGRIADLVTDRDIESDASVTSKRMSLNEHVNVDKAYKIGPVFETEENFARRARTLAEAFNILGQQAGEETVKLYMDNLIAALVAATDGVAALKNEAGIASVATYKSLLAADRMFKDQYKNVNAYVMNSDAFFDIAGDNLDNYKIENVAGLTIHTGMSASGLGKPIIVIDSPALSYDAAAGDIKNRILALTNAAGSVIERTGSPIVSQPVLGQENIGFQWQGETNTKLALKGYAWNIGAGGANPTSAALAVTANWDLVGAATNAAASMVVVDATE